jgi:hypothetical protein
MFCHHVMLNRDIVSSENCESKVFAERKIDERLIKAFPSTGLAGYFNHLASGARAFRGLVHQFVECADFSTLSLLGVQSCIFSAEPRDRDAAPEPSNKKDALNSSHPSPAPFAFLIVRPGFSLR